MSGRQVGKIILTLSMPSNKYLPTNKVSVDFYLKYNCREQSPEISDGEGRTETQPETVA